MNKRQHNFARNVTLAVPVLFALLYVLTAHSGETAATVPSPVLTWHNDTLRTGRHSETTLTLANVNSSTFGLKFILPADGKVDAQPLYLPNLAIPGKGTHNVVFVATEHASVYAYDADNGAALWQKTMLKAGEVPSDNRGCSQVTPEIGVTATPVIDPTAGTNGIIYVVAMSKDATGHYFQRLHALDVTTGAAQFGGPVDIQAKVSGTGAGSSGGFVIFDPKRYKSRPGLLLLNGIVYTAWSSHCDIRPYTGWIIGYNRTTLQQVSIFNTEPNGADASIWQSGAGLAASPAGYIFFLTGNGTFDTSLTPGGFPSEGDYGNSFVKLANGRTPVDYFTMQNTVAESASDDDLGSGGAMVIPNLTDSTGHVLQLAVGAGKDQIAYIVNRTNMGKFDPTANRVFQQIALGGRVFSSPAYYKGYLYYGPVSQALKAYQFTGAAFTSTPTSQSSNLFGYPGTTPSISANFDKNGIVWAAENTTPAVLHAYDASNLAIELYNSNQAGTRDHFGTGNKFIVPTIANGKVYVGTSSGVGVFGLLQ